MKVISSSVLVLIVLASCLLITTGYAAPATPKMTFQPADNQVLQVWFDGSPQLTILSPPAYQFNVIAKTSGGLWISHVHWDFGDGSTLDDVFSGQSEVSDSRFHQYSNQRSYVITVTANDSAGNIGTATETLNLQAIVSATTTSLSILPTASITNLQSPAYAVSGSGVPATLTVQYSGVVKGDAILVVLEPGTVVNGSVNVPEGNQVSSRSASSPDVCAQLTASQMAEVESSTGLGTNVGFCIIFPSSSFGSETVTFTLQFNSANNYSLVAAALVYFPGVSLSSVPPEAVIRFSIEVSAPGAPTLTTSVWSGEGNISVNCPSGCSEGVGSSISIQAAPSANWQFSSWSVDGVSCSGGSTSNPCTFAMPNNAVTILANFFQITSATPVAITNLESPTHVMVGGNATVKVTVAYAQVPNGDSLAVAVTDPFAAALIGGQVSSPDPCEQLSSEEMAAFQGEAPIVLCLVSPSSPSGSETVTFTLQFNSPGTHQLLAAATVVDVFSLKSVTAPSKEAARVFSLNVSNEGQFILSVSPTSLNVSSQSSNSINVTIQSVNGFSNPVNLTWSTASGNANGMTISFSPSIVTPPPNGVATSQATIVAACGVTPGTYSIVLTGSSGNLINQSHASVTFTGSCITATTTVSVTSLQSPSNELVGRNATVTLAVAYNGVYNGDFLVVGIMVTNGDPGQFATGSSYSFPDSCVQQQQYLDQAECMLQPSSPSGSETLTFSLPFNSPGNYSLHAGAFVFSAIQLGISEKARYIQDFSILVQNTPPPPNPDFTLFVAPNSLNMSSCNSPQVTTVTIRSTNNFNRPVTLMGNSPSGITVSFLPSVVTPTKNGTITSQATITVSSSMPLGKYIIQINGTSSNQLTHSALLTIAVTGCIPGFSFESILTGIALGIIWLACVKRRERISSKVLSNPSP